MSEIKKEVTNSIETDYFDDDDLWQIQGEKTPSKQIEDDEIIVENDIEENREKDEEKQEEINILSLEDLEGNESEEQDTENNQLETSELLEENNPPISLNIVSEKLPESEEIKVVEIPEKISSIEQEEIKKSINLLVEEGLKELQQKKEDLELAIEKLERRKQKIEEEMRTTFAGVSQDLAIRVKGFKDYLVGSLQDLAAAAEQLELGNNSNSSSWENSPPSTPPKKENSQPQFVEKNFKEETRQIRSLLDQYRTRPDYYGPPWQLRRTFEPIHAERVREWFFTQGGRGALRSMGSRLQNILVASAIISSLYQLYNDRIRILILADSPERLGEWRRGLQDCLGISRSDFGPNRGVVLFEAVEPLIQTGDRIVEEDDIPLVIMDQTDDKVSLSLLKFPLWLAFAPEQMNNSSNYYY